MAAFVLMALSMALAPTAQADPAQTIPTGYVALDSFQSASSDRAQGVLWVGLGPGGRAERGPHVSARLDASSPWGPATKLPSWATKLVGVDNAGTVYVEGEGPSGTGGRRLGAVTTAGVRSDELAPDGMRADAVNGGGDLLFLTAGASNRVGPPVAIRPSGGTAALVSPPGVNADCQAHRTAFRGQRAAIVWLCPDAIRLSVYDAPNGWSPAVSLVALTGRTAARGPSTSIAILPGGQVRVTWGTVQGNERSGMSSLLPVTFGVSTVTGADVKTRSFSPKRADRPSSSRFVGVDSSATSRKTVLLLSPTTGRGALVWQGGDEGAVRVVPITADGDLGSMTKRRIPVLPGARTLGPIQLSNTEEWSTPGAVAVTADGSVVILGRLSDAGAQVMTVWAPGGGWRKPRVIDLDSDLDTKWGVSSDRSLVWLLPPRGASPGNTIDWAVTRTHSAFKFRSPRGGLVRAAAGSGEANLATRPSSIRARVSVTTRRLDAFLRTRRLRVECRLSRPGVCIVNEARMNPSACGRLGPNNPWNGQLSLADRGGRARQVTAGGAARLTLYVQKAGRPCTEGEWRWFRDRLERSRTPVRLRVTVQALGLGTTPVNASQTVTLKR